MEVGDGDVFVRAMQVVRVLSPAKQQCIHAEQFLERSDHGDRTALADHDWCHAERFSNRGVSSLHEGTVSVGHEAGAAVLFDELQAAAGGRLLLQELAERLEQLVGILTGH